jgi:uncharacterized caspase-like protein/tetratricopeptide (TPR) repeat protein
MKRIASASAIVRLLLLLAFAMPFNAGAQDQGNRSLKLNKAVGATSAEAAKGPVQLWALIIGISNYKYGDQEIDGLTIANLAYATTDAKSVYDFLQSNAGGGFRDVSNSGHMILLTDEAATKANIEQQLNYLKEARPDDYFVIYIAGHGHIDTHRVRDSTTGKEKEVTAPYFVVYDTDPRDFKGTGVDMEWFRQTVEKNIPARRGLMLLDTCHSGGIVQPATRETGGERSNDPFLKALGTIEGLGIISASGAQELSLEKPDIDHGVFTYCLLEAMRGAADEDKNGIVIFNEAWQFLQEEVPRLTQGRQHPFCYASWGSYDIPLSIVSYSGNGPTRANRYATLVIRNPAVDGVEVAIDDEPRQSAPLAIEVSTQVQAGAHRISYSQKGTSKGALQITLEPGETKEVEIKLCFSEAADEDRLASLPVSIYLSDKEPSPEAKSLFHDGVDSFNRQKFNEAYDRFSRAIKANDGAYSRALVYRGRTEQSLGRNAQAVTSFQEALRLKPTDFETKTLLAEARFNSGGDVQNVYNTLREITTTYPDYAFAHVVLGDVLLWRGETFRAERELKRAVALNPNSPPAHLILANALMYQPISDKQKEAVTEAETALRQFEELSRKRVTFKGLSISHLIFGGGRYADAPAIAEAHYILAKALTRAVGSDPAFVGRKAYLDRARVSIKEAARLAQNVHDNARLAQVLVTSAENYLLTGDVSNAINDGEQALALSNSLPLAELKALVHHVLFRAYSSNQKCAKAATHLQAYIDIYQSHMISAQRDQYKAQLEVLKNCADANRQH